jgi:hypothetical protein
MNIDRRPQDLARDTNGVGNCSSAGFFDQFGGSSRADVTAGSPGIDQADLSARMKHAARGQEGLTSANLGSRTPQLAAARVLQESSPLLPRTNSCFNTTSAIGFIIEPSFHELTSGLDAEAKEQIWVGILNEAGRRCA